MMAEHELGSVVSPDALRPAEARLKRAHSVDAAHKSGLGIPLTVVLIVVGVLALYWRTTLSMVAIWERSETFSHGFVVVPIVFYLLWRRRDAIAAMEARPCWGALFGVAAMGFAWLVGELVSAASVSQFAVIAMIPFAVWAILGTRVVTALSIPLAFLFFAVPFGEFMVPTLMDRTADFTVIALRASGVPVYREGNFFLIPTGAWSVVEACSGLRYLIASLMVGCLYAYLTYRSPLRRATFIAASLVVPIVANWMRAYMIVMIGHLSSNKLAVGADHLIYGWVFFGVVILLLLLIGSRWREDDEPIGVHDKDHDNQLRVAGPVRGPLKANRVGGLGSVCSDGGLAAPSGTNGQLGKSGCHPPAAHHSEQWMGARFRRDRDVAARSVRRPGRAAANLRKGRSSRRTLHRVLSLADARGKSDYIDESDRAHQQSDLETGRGRDGLGNGAGRSVRCEHRCHREPRCATRAVAVVLGQRASYLERLCRQALSGHVGARPSR